MHYCYIYYKSYVPFLWSAVMTTLNPQPDETVILGPFGHCFTLALFRENLSSQFLIFALLHAWMLRIVPHIHGWGPCLTMAV